MAISFSVRRMLYLGTWNRGETIWNRGETNGIRRCAMVLLPRVLVAYMERRHSTDRESRPAGSTEKSYSRTHCRNHYCDAHAVRPVLPQRLPICFPRRALYYYSDSTWNGRGF